MEQICSKTGIRTPCKVFIVGIIPEEKSFSLVGVIHFPVQITSLIDFHKLMEYNILCFYLEMKLQ